MTRLLVRRAREGDIGAREALVTTHGAMVASIARGIMPADRNEGALEFADLIQAGQLALNRAIDNYDLSTATRFSTYAWTCIRGGMLREFTGQRFQFKPPSVERRYHRQVTLAIEQLRADNAPITAESLAATAEITIEAASSALEWRAAKTASMDAPRETSAQAPLPLAELTGRPDEKLDLAGLPVSKAERAYLTLRSEGYNRLELSALTGISVDRLRTIDADLHQRLTGHRDLSPTAPDAVAYTARSLPARIASPRLPADGLEAIEGTVTLDPALVERAFHQLSSIWQARLGHYSVTALAAGSDAALKSFALLAGAPQNPTNCLGYGLLKLRQQLVKLGAEPPEGRLALLRSAVPALAAAQARQVAAIDALPPLERELLDRLYVAGEGRTAIILWSAKRKAALEAGEARLTAHRQVQTPLAAKDLAAPTQGLVLPRSSTLAIDPSAVRTAFLKLDPVSQARLGTYCALRAERGADAALRVCTELFVQTKSSANANQTFALPLRRMASDVLGRERIGKVDLHDFRSAATPAIAACHQARLTALQTMSAADRSVLEPTLIEGRSLASVARTAGIPKSRLEGAFAIAADRLHKREAMSTLVPQLKTPHTERQLRQALVV